MATTTNCKYTCTVCGNYYELELQCTLFVATTTNWKYMCTVCHYLQCTLFLATTMNCKYTCTVCGYYYKLGVHVYCLWPIPRIGWTCVLFVATTTNWSTHVMFVTNSLQSTKVQYNNNIVSTMTYTLFVIVIFMYPLIVLPRVPPWWHLLTIMKYKARPAFPHYSESFECYDRLC